MNPLQIEDTYPLSPMQAGMLFDYLYQGEPGVDVTHVVLDAEEELEPELFRRAWQTAFEAHPAVRTAVRWEGLDEPRQEVYVGLEMPIDWLDWSSLSVAEQEECWKQLRHADLVRGFNLATPPLTRVVVVRLGESRQRVLWAAHHIVIDGLGMALMLQQVLEQHDAWRRGEEYRFGETPTLRDYVDWLQKVNVEMSADFWRERLAGLKEPTRPAFDHGAPRELATQPVHTQLSHWSSVDFTSRLKRWAKENGTTVNTVLQGAWAFLMSRYSGRRGVVFGVVKSCRRSSVEGAERIVGPLINTLPMVVDVDSAQGVLDWLGDVRASWVALREPEREQAPLVYIKQHSDIDARSALFESVYCYDVMSFDGMLRHLGSKWEGRTADVLGRANTPLCLNVYDGERVLIRITYDWRRFERAIVERMFEHVTAVVESMISGRAEQVGDLSMMSDAERHQILVEWNDTATAYPDDRCVHELFDAQVARTPDAVAVSYGSESLTYAELNARANRLAHLLQRHGVGPEVMVGIFVERGVEMLLGVLGVLKAGGVYVPLDPTHPEARTAYVLESAAVPVLLTQQRLRAELPNGAATVLCLDAAPELADEPACNPSARAAPESLAYAIYTSGSTGRPKGVQISHGNVVAFLHAMRQKPGIVASDSLLAVTTLSFDIAGLELFLPLCVGARVVIAPAEVAMDGHAIQQTLREDDITVMQATPATWQMLVQTDWPGDPNLKVLCGGEALPQALADAVVDRSGELWNMYGPTETTIWSSVSRVTRGEGSVTIGRPIANERMYILNEALRPVSIGTVGELYIGGAGVARGYVGRPDLTAERFVPDPFGGWGGRLYQTGDLARFREDGSLEFLGRTDHQVKLRGYRIELGEIDAALVQNTAVRDAVVLCREDEPGDKRLVAYVVGETRRDFTSDDLRAHLRQLLPEHMVPSAFVFLDALPLNANGKVDRGALPAPEHSGPKSVKYVEPRTETERVLAAIWAEVLKVERVGIYDHFLYDLGGHSLTAIQVTSRVRALMDFDLRLKRLFAQPTIAALAPTIDVLRWTAAGAESAPSGEREEADL